ncbi:uncharacterized protein LOC134824349 [Bolinopsis microptera]|uniref:uncharacterized protein LOC134824349 n=1 Tax=Bolinopsis microptera TaxID=2820187 RepID=UPI00307A08CC
MKYNEMMILIWCCLGALCNSSMAFSLGILQNYIYSAFLYYSPRPELMQSGQDIMHVFATTILMVGCGFCWTLGYIKLVLSPLVFHICATVILIGATITLKWWYPTIAAFTIYCVINGYLTGVLHVYFSEVLSKLDPKKSGLYNGLYGFFFGVSGILANIIAGLYINPANNMVNKFPHPVDNSDYSNPSKVFLVYNVSVNSYDADPDMINRTCDSWLIYGMFYAVCYLPGIYFISCKKSSEKRKPGTEELESAYDTSVLLDNEQDMISGGYGSTNEYTHSFEKELDLGGSFAFFFGSKEAYLYLSCTVSIGIASLVSADLYKSYGMKVYDNDRFYNLAGTVVPLIGGAGRVLWGALYDHLSEKCIFAFNSLVVTVSLVGMTMTRHYPFLYIFFVATTASSLGTMSCLAPAIKKRFSNCSFSLILGLAMCGEVLGTLLYMLVTSALAHLLSDAVMLYILAVPPCITFLLSLVTL